LRRISRIGSTWPPCRGRVGHREVPRPLYGNVFSGGSICSLLKAYQPTKCGAAAYLPGEAVTGFAGDSRLRFYEFGDVGCGKRGVLAHEAHKSFPEDSPIGTNVDGIRTRLVEGSVTDGGDDTCGAPADGPVSEGVGLWPVRVKGWSTGRCAAPPIYSSFWRPGRFSTITGV